MNLSYFVLSRIIHSTKPTEGFGAINLEDNWVDEILILKQETKDIHQPTCKKWPFLRDPMKPHENVSLMRKGN